MVLFSFGVCCVLGGDLLQRFGVWEQVVVSEASGVDVPRLGVDLGGVQEHAHGLVVVSVGGHALEVPGLLDAVLPDSESGRKP